MDRNSENIVDQEVGVRSYHQHSIPPLSLPILILRAFQVNVRLLILRIYHILPNGVRVKNAHHMGSYDVNNEQHQNQDQVNEIKIPRERLVVIDLLK